MSGDVLVDTPAIRLHAGDRVMINGSLSLITHITNKVYESEFTHAEQSLLRVYYQSDDGEVGVKRYAPDALVAKEEMT